MNIKPPRARGRPHLARKAIAEFVESNIPRFNGWLEQVAGGIPQCDKDGVVQLSPNGVPQWLVKPDPATALKLVSEICEYHLPKLSRSDVAAVVQVEQQQDVRQMTTAELQNLVLQQLGILSTGEPVEPIDITPLPDLQEAPTRDD